MTPVMPVTAIHLQGLSSWERRRRQATGGSDV